ncbi:MAG: TonB family protein [Bdellovibrio sp.]
MDVGWQLMEESFQKSLLWSLAAHALILILTIVKMAFVPSESLILQSAVRVDLVALPDKILDPVRETPEASTTPPSPQQKVLTDSAEIQLKKSSRQRALKKLKALETLEKLEREETSLRPKESFKGNQISPGSELRGVARLEHDDYVGQMERHIKSNWFRPEWMRSQRLHARVLIKFDNLGKLLKVQILSSSGNKQFDDLATDTVQKSDPLPRPPEKFKDLFQVQGVVLIFGDHETSR